MLLLGGLAVYLLRRLRNGGVGTGTALADNPTLTARTAALGQDWPAGVTVGDFLAGLDVTTPPGLAVMTDAARLLRGSGYAPFGTAAAPEPPAAREVSVEELLDLEQQADFFLALGQESPFEARLTMYARMDAMRGLLRRVATKS